MDHAAKVHTKNMNILMMKSIVNSVEVPVTVLAQIAHSKFIVIDMAETSVSGVAQLLLALVRKALIKFTKNRSSSD